MRFLARSGARSVSFAQPSFRAGSCRTNQNDLRSRGKPRGEVSELNAQSGEAGHWEQTCGVVKRRRMLGKREMLQR